jgi:hypothetical protein
MAAAYRRFNRAAKRRTSGTVPSSYRRAAMAGTQPVEAVLVLRHMSKHRHAWQVGA